MKRSQLRQGRRRQRERVSERTVRTVYERQLGYCGCGCGRRIARGLIGYHHVFPKAKWPELVDHPDNGVGVAADCHANHETASRRLPRRAVKLAERLAAGNPRMEAYLEETYR